MDYEHITQVEIDDRLLANIKSREWEHWEHENNHHVLTEAAKLMPDGDCKSRCLKMVSEAQERMAEIAALKAGLESRWTAARKAAAIKRKQPE